MRLFRALLFFALASALGLDAGLAGAGGARGRTRQAPRARAKQKTARAKKAPARRRTARRPGRRLGARRRGRARHQVRESQTAEGTIRALADRIVEASRESIAKRGAFRVVLAGGKTPRVLYELLASPRYRGRVQWQKWQVYFGDERAVEPSSPESNYRMASEALLGRVPIPKSQVHRIRGELGAERAARQYRRVLSGKRLDFVLLGMGADGHTASLFPGDSKSARPGGDVAATTSPEGPKHRVTLTLPALRRAERIAFLITGSEKADRLRQVLEQASSPRPTLPAAKVTSKSGTVEWFVDTAAAGALGD